MEADYFVLVPEKMSIKIKLNKPDCRYIAGEVLQATVNIENDEPKKVRCEFFHILKRDFRLSTSF